MILQALNEFYQRVSQAADSEIAPPGLGPQQISFCLEINREGQLLQIAEMRIPAEKGNKLFPKKLLLPKEKKKTSGIKANFLWDNSGYVLGIDGKGKPERSAQTFAAFKTLHEEKLGNVNDEGAQALLAFLRNWVPPARAEDLPTKDIKPEDLLGANLVFRLVGDPQFLHQRPALQNLVQAEAEQGGQGKEHQGICLVTGQKGTIARLHPAIKGVRGAQSMGANIISFDKDAFTSYGKEQNYNAPISTQVAFAYTTALNYLLRPESRQKATLGDVTYLFWSTARNELEDMLGGFFEYTPPEVAKGLANEVKHFFDALGKGKFPPGVDPDMRFCLLGISPNASRLAIRLWLDSTVGAIATNLAEHFKRLRIQKRFESELDYPSFPHLLLETATQHKFDNISPLLGGAFMRAVLINSRYPEALLGNLLIRARAEREVNYYRAALLKAVLIRNHELEISMSLNPASQDIGYNLGRLFAVMEKAQVDAINPKATIRDRFFGAASATPGNVFPLLMRGAQAHLAKAEYGHHLDQQMQTIAQAIGQFPAHLKLEQQGQFMLGYYHQRQDLYTTKKTPAAPVAAPANQ